MDPVSTGLSVEAASMLAKGIMTSMAFAGAAIGEGFLIGKALEAMGRNPEVSGELFTRMIIGVALAESYAIYALVLFFII